MKDEFLKELHHEVSNSGKRLKSVKFWNNALKIGAIALTFLITITLGWDFGDSSVFTDVLTRNIAKALGALATLVTAITKFWNTEKKLLKEEYLKIRLDAMRTKYLIFIKEQKTEGEISALKSDFYEILEKRAHENQYQ